MVWQLYSTSDAVVTPVMLAVMFKRTSTSIVLYCYCRLLSGMCALCWLAV